MEQKSKDSRPRGTLRNAPSRDLKDLNLDGMDSPTFIVGLPGIGNVGKIVTDYIIEHLNAKEIGKFYVDTPPMVFPTQDGIEFPSVRMYHVIYGKNGNAEKVKGKMNGKKKGKGGKREEKNSFLFIAGDYQPREAKCFDFCAQVLEIFQKVKGKEIIILGGASLPAMSKTPEVYAIASKNELMKRYSKIAPGLKTAHGNLGPIVGVAGVLLGMAKDKNIDATAFLTETTDKNYFDSRSVSKALDLVNKLTGISVDVKKFDARVKKIDAEISALHELAEGEQIKMGKGSELKLETTGDEDFDIGYIG